MAKHSIRSTGKSIPKSAGKKTVSPITKKLKPSKTVSGKNLKKSISVKFVTVNVPGLGKLKLGTGVFNKLKAISTLKASDYGKIRVLLGNPPRPLLGNPPWPPLREKLSDKQIKNIFTAINPSNKDKS